MSAYIFSTNLRTLKKRITQWLFILGGTFLVSTQGYNFFLTYTEIYLLGFLVGLWMLAQGLFFNYFFRKITLTIDDRVIHYHHSKTMFKPEQNFTFDTADIQKILLDNYHVRLILNDQTRLKLSLPTQNKYHFIDFKARLQRFAEKNNIPFESRDWFKKIYPFTSFAQRIPTVKKKERV